MSDPFHSEVVSECKFPPISVGRGRAGDGGHQRRPLLGDTYLVSGIICNEQEWHLSEYKLPVVFCGGRGLIRGPLFTSMSLGGGGGALQPTIEVKTKQVNAPGPE